MRKIINRKQAVNCLIIMIAALLILAVFPCRIFREDIRSFGNESPAGAFSVGGEAVILQQFLAEYDRIGDISFMYNADEDFDYTLRVFREKTGELVREIASDKPCPAGERKYATTYVNLACEVGESYFYTVEVTRGEIEVLYEMTANSGTSNNGYMQYAGEVKAAYNVVSGYTYRQPLRKTLSLALMAAVAAIAAVLLFIVNKVLMKVETVRALLLGLTTPRKVLRKFFTPVIAVLAAAAVVAIGPLHMFSIFIADIIVMILGVLLLAAILLYMLYHEEGDTDATAIDISGIRNVAQSVCIALALWSCVAYMNGLYDIFHDIAWRRMAFFLGLAIVVTWSAGELVNWYNAVLLIAGVITARIYYVRNLPDMVDEFHVSALFWTSMCIVLIFILSGYVIRCLVLKIMSILGRDGSKPGEMQADGLPGLRSFREHPFMGIMKLIYILLTVILVSMMVARRYTRDWPIIMAVIGGVYIFRLLFWKERESFTDNLTRGILLHFGACMIYCLMYRPYEAYRFVRFPFVFHTVTVTAEYMALVMAAALVRLFEAYRLKKDIKKCVPQMTVFGFVASYTLFTMSRTAMTGIVACGLVMWLAYGCLRDKAPSEETTTDGAGTSGDKTERTRKVRNERTGTGAGLLTTAGMVVCSLLVCFPIAFTAQKALPGLVGEPRLMEIEQYPQTLLISRDYQSDDYITFTRFSKAFIHKMLGLDENLIKWDMYTIYGSHPEIYYSPTQLEQMQNDGTGDISDRDCMVNMAVTCANDTAGEPDGISRSLQNGDAGPGELRFTDGILLTKEAPQSLMTDDEDGGFVPPHEYSLEGEPPEEWYDEEYWAYYPETGEWEFLSWKLDEEAAEDVSNGRMDIYRAYMDQMNDEGHEEMGALLDDGSLAAHAHNIYLQVAYDHGKIIGIVFAIWCVFTCIYAVIIFAVGRYRVRALGILPAVAVTFTVCGVTEWISHPCNPVGMIMMLVCCAMLAVSYTGQNESDSK